MRGPWTAAGPGGARFPSVHEKKIAKHLERKDLEVVNCPTIEKVVLQLVVCSVQLRFFFNDLIFTWLIYMNNTKRKNKSKTYP